MEAGTPKLDRFSLGKLSIVGLNCGCGSELRPHCLNTDRMRHVDRFGNATRSGRLAQLEVDGQPVHFLQHDALEPYPIEDASFEWIFSEHFIEHLPAASGIRWLREMRRLLAPGGVLRVTTPDLRKYAEGYLEPQASFFTEHRRNLEARSAATGGPQRFPARRAWMLNQIFRLWEHEWIYDLEELRYSAERAGFDPERVSERSFGQGARAEAAALDLEWRRDETLYVEMCV